VTRTLGLAVGLLPITRA